MWGEDVTEAEWLASTDAQKMLDELRWKVSDRKARLVACAFCRMVVTVFDDTQRRALEAVESFADGHLGSDDLWTAINGFVDRHGEFFDAIGMGERRPSKEIVIACLLSSACIHPDQQTEPWDGAFDASLAVRYVAPPSRQGHFSVLIRDIFGNPFCPVTFDPSWRTTTAVAVAQQMYASRDFSAMPILADALQDAGCVSSEILDHCRGPGPHVRGCWVVDLVLGKE